MICTAGSLQAQDTIQQKQVISLNLLSYVAGIYAPRWTAGYSRKINERWWAGVEAGYGSSWLSVHGREGALITKDYNLFEIRPSIYYDLKGRGKLKHLISAELFYIHHKDHFEDGWYHSKSNGIFYDYDAADYKRIKTGLNLNLNTIYYFGKRLVLWQQIGVGIRNRKASYSNFENRSISERYNDGEDHWNWLSTDNYIKKEGSYIGFNLNLEFKLAYIF